MRRGEPGVNGMAMMDLCSPGDGMVSVEVREEEVPK